MPKFPDVTVELIGGDGNAFAVLLAAKNALKRAGHGDQVEAFLDEAMSGDYENMLATVVRWMEVS